MAWMNGQESVEIGGDTLPGVMKERARELGEYPALIDGSTGATASFSTLGARIEGVAGGLAARGFRRGDVLALWAPNLPPWAGVAIGAMAAGGAVTGVNPSYTERELTAQLSDAGAATLVTVPSLAERARSCAESAGVREVLVLGERKGFTPVSGLLSDQPAPADVVSDADVAFLPYSSGTTGLPKGVMLTHSNLVTQLRQINTKLRLGPGDTVLAVAPFFHMMGFMITLSVPLASGATVVTMSRFNLDHFLALIERYRVTFTAVPPPLMQALAAHPTVDDYDLSSLELIASGGAPLSAEVQSAVAERLPGVAVGQGWGMTETTVAVTCPDRSVGTVAGSVGRLVPNTELRVVEPETGRDLAVGERGELWVRGPQVMRGYLDRPEATTETIDEDAWLHTGDLGFIDAEGNVFVVDRLKELIKVNAYQVPPAELEALLTSHPAVADVAVVARPDNSRGEVPVAVVVPREVIAEEALVSWVAERVAPHKRIRDVRFVDAIPKTPSGKILRRELVTSGD